MSRKNEAKAKDAIVTVNIDDFTRTRDSVIVSLASLQSAVSDLSRAYINHANTVLNRGPVGIESSLGSGLAGGLASTLLENGLLAGLPRHVSPHEGKVEGEKKKRKRVAHDPNAPKRALTPYFLYMSHNRAAIAEEMGSDAKPKDVAEEGTKRWAEMPESEKGVWKKLYADNLAVYRAKMQAYKAGLAPPEDDNATADIQLQQSVAAAEAEAEESSSSGGEEEDGDEDESSPEPKEPTPPPSGKRRRVGGKANTASSPVVSKKASPEKKKTQTPVSKGKKEDPASARKPLGSTEGKRNKKKRKSEVGGDE
ncbi:hypothetical protein BGW36DRAFT_374386 [Talaromyces proteolyticus]|uniref:HMG box domain-containing protein n=1 Tax=Talaromyces proteolyticus TaxID=1131652 RepID=A0AAD4KWK4_9EURO|nr:uncharacterized protein BGW36DRAFT_374386 [Talaromyces proteolyticus]KAH8700547.1 hypothetical protein BGW36DRAFT_374386 [Talaromyces proteolyticus]